jgi:hypothetical protein
MKKLFALVEHSIVNSEYDVYGATIIGVFEDREIIEKFLEIMNYISVEREKYRKDEIPEIRNGNTYYGNRHLTNPSLIKYAKILNINIGLLYGFVRSDFNYDIQEIELNNIFSIFSERAEHQKLDKYDTMKSSFSIHVNESTMKEILNNFVKDGETNE